MLLSNQQKYILEILKEFKYLRVRQLHALVQRYDQEKLQMYGKIMSKW